MAPLNSNERLAADPAGSIRALQMAYAVHARSAEEYAVFRYPSPKIMKAFRYDHGTSFKGISRYLKADFVFVEELRVD